MRAVRSRRLFRPFRRFPRFADLFPPMHPAPHSGEALEREEKIRAGESARRGWELIMAVDDEEAGCSLCYTSGTTGRPKGVLTSYRGSYLAAVANAFEARITTDSVCECACC